MLGFDGPVRVFEKFEVENDPELAAMAFQAVEHLLGMHASVQHIEGLPISLKFLLGPLDHASTYVNTLWTLVNDMSDHEMRNRTELDNDVYAGVIVNGWRAVQTAFKVSLLGFKSPKSCFEIFDLHKETLSVEELESLGMAKFLNWHIAMPQNAWLGYIMCCTPHAEICEILHFEEIRVALFLQLLQVMSHMSDAMAAHLTVLATSRFYKMPYFRGFWARMCCQILPVVSVGPEPGLTRVLSLVKAIAEIFVSDEIFDTVRDLTGLIEDLETVATHDGLKDGNLINRVKVLSYLQCSNLECTTLFYSWETKKSMVCSGCKHIRYCSEKCQKMDWKAHKRACRLIAAKEIE